MIDSPAARDRRKAGELVRDFWPVCAFLLAIAAAGGGLSMQVATIAENQKAELAQQQLMTAKLDHIAEGLITAQTTSLYNTADIADLKKRVHELETRR